MHPYRTARLEIAIQNHRHLGVKHRTSGKTATNGLIYFLRVHTCFLREHHCLSDGGKMKRHHNLVGKLADISTADFADMHGGTAHREKNRLHLLESFLLATYHDGHGTVNCLRLTAAHRCIKHIIAFCHREVIHFL